MTAEDYNAPVTATAYLAAIKLTALFHERGESANYLIVAY
jgi:hypothetical protein